MCIFVVCVQYFKMKDKHKDKRAFKHVSSRIES